MLISFGTFTPRDPHQLIYDPRYPSHFLALSRNMVKIGVWIAATEAAGKVRVPLVLEFLFGHQKWEYTLCLEPH